MKEMLKRAVAAAAAIILINVFGIDAYASYLTDTENADEYIEINKDELPHYSSKYDVGARENLRLVFNIPAEELDNALFIDGLDNICYFRFEIHNARWRNVLLKRTNKSDIDYVNEGAKDNDDRYSWDITMKNEQRPITSINQVSYNEEYFEKMQYAVARYDSDGRSLEETGNMLDGEYPLLFRTTGDGEVTIDISVYTGDDFYDTSKFREDDYEYIGTVTVAETGSKNHTEAKAEGTTKTTPQAAAEKTDKQTEQKPVLKPVTEQTTEAEAKITAEVPIGQPYYTINGAGFEMDSPAFISNGHTMLPLRAMTDVIGIDSNCLTYEPENKTAVIKYGGSVISVSAGSAVMYKDNVPTALEAPAIIQNGRMYLPMRDVAEALGFTDISFDAVSKTVIINI